jgi:hypothetical protein
MLSFKKDTHIKHHISAHKAIGFIVITEKVRSHLLRSRGKVRSHLLGLMGKCDRIQLNVRAASRREVIAFVVFEGDRHASINPKLKEII